MVTWWRWSNADGSAGLLDSRLLADNYAQGIIDLGSVDGTVYAILAKANSKSTVWYKPSSFAELGLEPPATWDDLLAIQKAYIDAGKKPWEHRRRGRLGRSPTGSRTSSCVPPARTSTTSCS